MCWKPVHESVCTHYAFLLVSLRISSMRSCPSLMCLLSPSLHQTQGCMLNMCRIISISITPEQAFYSVWILTFYLCIYFFLPSHTSTHPPPFSLRVHSMLAQQCSSVIHVSFASSLLEYSYSCSLQPPVSSSEETERWRKAVYGIKLGAYREKIKDRG